MGIVEHAMARRSERRFELGEGEFWCDECQDLRRLGQDVSDADGDVVQELDSDDAARCLSCGAELTRRAPESCQQQVEFYRWLDDCKRQNRMGPSPGGAAGQLGVSRARIYAMVQQGILERVDCPVEGYEATFISQRSINRRKAELRDLEAKGIDPGRGGQPLHRGQEKGGE